MSKLHNQLVMRPKITQNVAYTGSAGTITNPVGDNINVVRVYCTTEAFVAIGKAPVATTSDMPVAAKAAVDISIHPGEKVSAIQASSGGNLYVTEMTQ